ncbi:hypothetical protein HanRHA438_Chr10g0473921 [Helianthus annuus]|nr:hypothetical protein HanHA300_Chr10g0378961 [Helianthus annuus]KAJ0531477.1 hypothetical protein HanHA89_Chr10g0401521 [Helianthus annuus]KAJ0698319.1 hypothetical protein HanLR1_Chr10g0378751 [Helianthus annuus]KAJ0881400.1 hypothetical protein HanRHA438_Chr10g0473921 [Helianthus annuus]
MRERLVLKIERHTKATRSKTEARSAKCKSGGPLVPGAQANYIYIFFYISHRFLVFPTQNIAISKVQQLDAKNASGTRGARLRPKKPRKIPINRAFLALLVITLGAERTSMVNKFHVESAPVWINHQKLLMMMMPLVNTCSVGF